ncbi:class I SAM-dependent methyltransferase [candidate division KSB1 bacterium]|nr:class I SAM-dependent methyltransferase [candidate division KSB1 bacterium]
MEQKYQSPLPTAEELDLVENLYEYIIPKFREANDIVVSMLDFNAEQSLRIIDLGCGFGNLSARVLQMFPHAVVFGLDDQPAILERARRRLEEFDDRFVAFARDFNDNTWHEGLEQVDAVVSTFTLDYLTEARHRDLIHEAAALLNPGGRWVGCEFFRAKDDRINRVFHDIEVQLVQEKMREGAVTRDEIERLSESTILRRNHYVVDAAQKMHWLQEAGLKTLDIPWKFLNLTILGAVK